MAQHTVVLTAAQEEALAYFATSRARSFPPLPAETPDEHLQRLVTEMFDIRLSLFRERQAETRDIAYGRLSSQDKATVDAILAPHQPPALVEESGASGGR